ncbi:MAG TPA: porin family protein [Paracoccus sp.]|nr:porin family protein [Paracoccus sp. (in: a-proteobacteria)]
MKLHVNRYCFSRVFAAVSGALLAGSVQAGGYVAPIVEHLPAPMVGNQVAAPFSWTGPYAGLSAGSARTKARNVTLYDIAKEWKNSDVCAGFPEGVTMIAGKDPGQEPGILNCEVLWEEWQEDDWWESDDAAAAKETTVLGYNSGKKTHSTLGIFAGYRHQWSNNVVGGVEASYIHSSDYDSARIMGQAGYAFGRVLPYLSLGYDFEEKGAAYGVGVDAALTNRLIGGLVYSKSEDTDRIEARLGWKF